MSRSQKQENKKNEKNVKKWTSKKRRQKGRKENSKEKVHFSHNTNLAAFSSSFLKTEGLSKPEKILQIKVEKLVGRMAMVRDASGTPPPAQITLA